MSKKKLSYLNPIVHSIIFTLLDSQKEVVRWESISKSKSSARRVVADLLDEHYEENEKMLNVWVTHALNKLKEKEGYHAFLNYLEIIEGEEVLLRRLVDFNLYLKSTTVVEHQAKIITLMGILDELHEDNNLSCNNRLVKLFASIDNTSVGFAVLQTIAALLYGYPFCCISDHLTWNSSRDGSRPAKRKAIVATTRASKKVWWLHSGYVPCECCAKQVYPEGKDEIVNAINQNRIHLVSFVPQYK